MLRRFFFVFLIAIGFSLAQNTKEEFWVTASVGYPFNFMVGAGANDIIGDMSIRAAVAASDDGGINLMLDGLIDASALELSSGLNAYGVLGVLLKLSGNEQRDNSFHANLAVGVEHRLAEMGLENMGVYMELGPSFKLTPSFDSGFHARAGINVHF